MGASSFFKYKNVSPAAGVGTLLVAGVLISSLSLKVSAGVGAEDTDSLPKTDPPLRRARLVALATGLGEDAGVVSFANNECLVKRRGGLLPVSAATTVAVSARLLTELNLVDLPLWESDRKVSEYAALK